MMWLCASAGGLSSLSLPWKTSQQHDTASAADDDVDDAVYDVRVKTVEPSVIDFDNINSRFMLLRQQQSRSCGFAFAAEQFLHLSWSTLTTPFLSFLQISSDKITFPAKKGKFGLW